ncbi:MAG: helix-turn-helix domain-containing protein [Ktedonobacterales bacterium]
MGIGRYHPGVRGLARSYQDARAAVLLGRHFQGANRLHCLDGLGAAAFIGISEEQTKIALARHLLSPLDQDPELLDTVSVFFAEDCCPSTTAQRLIIHRNTLTYRLDKVASLTGLDPRRFDDAVQMRLALFLRTLQSNYAQVDNQDVCADAQ